MFQKLLILALCSVVLPLVATVTVSTNYGDIQGFTASYPNAPGSIKSVTKFLGVPYAAPPIEDLRLKAPQPPTPWKPKVFNATRHGNICMQGPEFEFYIRYFTQNFTYSEDCLVLDVYTPDVSLKLPVMVYIHGGGYMSGTSLVHPGDGLALFGVVVVSIQYRLGAFGFATTGDSAAPGNFGMLDQVQALKWIKENIEKFGGDPNKVTIFGVSAGGSSVSLHLLSPLSKDLFHRAIAESGVDLSTFASQPLAEGVRYTNQLAQKLGCEAGSSNDRVACLRTKSSTELLTASRFMLWQFYEDILWSPVVVKPFLPDSPRNLRKEGKFKKADLMVGYTSQEGPTFLGIMVNMTLGPSNIDNGVSPDLFKNFLTKLAQLRNKRKETAALMTDATEFMYTPWPDNTNQYALRSQLADLIGDYMIVAPTHEVAAIHSKVAPVYMFEFGHRSEKGTINPPWMGVAHGDNVPYDFGIPLLRMSENSSIISYNEADKNVSLFVMTAYSNFAKTGDPNTPAPVGVEWGRFNSSHMAYLHIDTSPKMASSFHPRRMAFWNEYRPKLLEVEFDIKENVDSSGVGLGATLGAVFSIVIMLVF